ncbi:MAG: hypothetical protein KDA28_08915, partial [Phycisphaerales bacterium]|nr:hypothetical protein [Phycisphaerales bacterium]
MRRLPLEERHAALAAALPVCSPEEAEAFAPDLIEIASSDHEIADDAFATCVRAWARVDDLSRSAISGMVRAGRDRIREALTRSPDLREPALSILESTSDLRLAWIAGDVLGDEHLGPRAERLLLGLTLVASDLDPEVLGTTSFEVETKPRVRHEIEDEDIVAFIAEGRRTLERYSTHKRRGVLLLALAFADHPEIRKVIESEGAAHTAMNGLLRWLRSPLARTRAIEWLGSDTFGAASLDRLSRAESAEDHECVLRRSHLLLRPSRAARLSMLSIRARTIEGSSEVYIPTGTA